MPGGTAGASDLRSALAGRGPRGKQGCAPAHKDGHRSGLGVPRAQAGGEPNAEQRELVRTRARPRGYMRAMHSAFATSRNSVLRLRAGEPSMLLLKLADGAQPLTQARLGWRVLPGGQHRWVCARGV